MAWSWEGIEFTCEFAFGDAPLAASYTYTDVSDQVRYVPSIFRGKTSELDELAPGTCTILLDNRARQFDPDHSSSPYYPDVVPMVPVRLSATFNSVTYVVFSGFVLGWRQVELESGTDQYVEVTCVDGTRFMRNGQLGNSAYEIEVLKDSPTHYWTLQDVTEEGDSAADVGSSPVTASTLAIGAIDLDTFAPIEPSFEVVETPFPQGGAKAIRDGMLSTSSTGGGAPVAIEFWLRMYPGFIVRQQAYAYVSVNVGGSNTRLQMSAGDSSETGTWSLFYSSEANNQSLSTGFSGPTVQVGLQHVVLYVSGSTLYLRVNGREVWSDTVDGFDLGAASEGAQLVAYRWGDTVSSPAVSHFAVYDTLPSTDRFDEHWRVGLHAHGRSRFASSTEFGGERIDRVLDELGWPSGRRSIDRGDTRQARYFPAGEDAIGYIRHIEAGERGLFCFDVDGNARFIDRSALALSTSVATFSDDGAAGAIKYADVQRDGNHVNTITNVATVSYSSTGAITRRDATSRAAYGDSHTFIDAPTIPNGKTASAAAEYALRLGKDPASRIPLIVAPMRVRDASTGQATDNEADKLLALEIGDIVTVERTPGGVGSQVVKRLIVQGIQHEIAPEQWFVTLHLSPAPPAADDVPYLQLGDATYGRLGAAYANALIY